MAFEILSGRTGKEGLERKWERAQETLEGGKTNDLRVSEDGTVLKKYSSWDKWALIQTGARLLDRRQPIGEVPLPRVDRRIYNEHAFRDEYTGEMDIPDILEREGKIVEMEMVEGEDLPDYLEENPGEAEEYGSKVAEFAVENHLEGRAFTDFRTSNFLVKDRNSSLAFVDAESVTFNASTWDRKMDIITCFSSVRQTDAYDGFVSGFQEDYRGNSEELDKAIDWVPARPVADLTSIVHAATDKELDRMRKAFRNKVTPEVLQHYTLKEMQEEGKEKIYDRFS